MSIIKDGIGFLIAAGVGTFTSNAVKIATPEKLGTIKKVAVGLGSLAFSSMVADKTVDYFNGEWDAIANSISKIKEKVSIKVIKKDETTSDQEEKNDEENDG